MSLRPINNNLVATELEKETKTQSGLLIASTTAQKKSGLADVVSVSKDITDINPGDRIAFSDYQKTEIKIDGKDYILLNVDDVLAIVKE